MTARYLFFATTLYTITLCGRDCNVNPFGGTPVPPKDCSEKREMSAQKKPPRKNLNGFDI